jgi:hypothetical protein
MIHWILRFSGLIQLFPLRMILWTWFKVKEVLLLFYPSIRHYLTAGRLLVRICIVGKQEIKN